MFWGKVKQGLDVMKFANNHEKDLEPWPLVYLIACAQASITIIIELIAMYKFCQYSLIFDIITQFVCFLIIGFADDMCYTSYPMPLYKSVLKMNPLTIKKTTSSKCNEAVDKKYKLSDDEEIEICYLFKERSTFSKFLRVVYLIFRFAYVGIYFYFFPCCILIWSLYMPWSEQELFNTL